MSRGDMVEFPCDDVTVLHLESACVIKFHRTVYQNKETKNLHVNTDRVQVMSISELIVL